jgi:hypothetical protein
MVTTIATLPLPGLLTKKNAEFQQKKMVATDVRVDSVTEGMSGVKAQADASYRCFAYDQNVWLGRQNQGSNLDQARG